MQGFGPFIDALERTRRAPRFYVVTGGELAYTHTVEVSGPGAPCRAVASGGGSLAAGPSLMAITSIGGPGKRGGVFAMGTTSIDLVETASCGGVSHDTDHLQWIELQFNPATGEGDFVDDDGLITGDRLHQTETLQPPSTSSPSRWR